MNDLIPGEIYLYAPHANVPANEFGLMLHGKQIRATPNSGRLIYIGSYLDSYERYLAKVFLLYDWYEGGGIQEWPFYTLRTNVTLLKELRS